jgi:hypothetical protein
MVRGLSETECRGWKYCENRPHEEVAFSEAGYVHLIRARGEVMVITTLLRSKDEYYDPCNHQKNRKPSYNQGDQQV